jgi:hypothetical protein
MGSAGMFAALVVVMIVLLCAGAAGAEPEPGDGAEGFAAPDPAVTERARADLADAVAEQRAAAPDSRRFAELELITDLLRTLAVDGDTARHARDFRAGMRVVDATPAADDARVTLDPLAANRMRDTLRGLEDSLPIADPRALAGTVMHIRLIKQLLLDGSLPAYRSRLAEGRRRLDAGVSG